MTDRTLTVKTVKTVDVNDIGYELWCGALDRWEDADDDTREAVFDRICDWTEDEEEVDMTTVNDLIWFECDDLFYPDDEDDEEDEEDEETDEDEEDEEDDEDDEDEETDDTPKPNTILVGRIGGQFKQLPDGSVENTIVHSTLNNGEETVIFVTARFGGKQAEIVRTQLSVGDLCCIEGRRCEETTDTNVVKQYIEVGHVTFLATRRQNND